ncbi:Eco57I restriction-modification methylase domain-containing protein [Bacillus velezensis]|uniref:Eco57I restriction-modification methylase domain-containing protein n=1 Tax=Bacillus velezensis TaxID=492670 RepID=UPI003877A891
MNKKCQVFTPGKIVEEMLDKIDYKKKLYGKKVLEDSCGNGNILLMIVERYINSSIIEGYSLTSIKRGLESDIYGIEIDRIHYKKCLVNLDRIAEKYDLHDVHWKVFNEDSLKKKWEIKFDYIIGNPPYIKYSEINPDTRRFIKETFITCSIGKFDYCYAFVESALNNLNKTGKLIYLIPNSIFKNVFGKDLRNLLLNKLNEIIDYTDFKIFPNVLTSSALILVDNNRISNEIKYCDAKKGFNHKISKSNLGEKWVFKKERKKNRKHINKFSDFFSASISIATLLNEAFVIKDFEYIGEFIKTKNNYIEKEAIKRAMSPKSMNYNKSEIIIFPYYYKNNYLKRYTKKEFGENFPEAVRYLRKFEDKLKKRKSSKNTEWFEYGRTQALKNLNQHKLLLSTVVTKKIKVYELDEDCIPYSGIYIISKGSKDLNIAKEILLSEDFFNYVKDIGINANGESIRITANDINNFEFNLEELIKNGHNEI